MNHRVPLIVAMIVLVALSGCSGLLPLTNETTPTPSATAPPVQTYPPGYSARGITQPLQAVERHERVLLNAESYTLKSTKEITWKDDSYSVTYLKHANFTSKRAYERSNITKNSHTGVQESYYDEEGTYTRAIPLGAEEPQYDGDRPIDFFPRDIYTGNIIRRYIANASFGPAERLTRNGTTLYRCTATAMRTPRPFLGENASDMTVLDFRATVLVDKHGLIHTFTYSVTAKLPDGGRVMDDFTYHASINATTITEPDWLDEAKAAAK